MRIAFIEPFAHIGKYGISDIHMVLPEACELSKNYMAHYREVDGYKILDNGAAEGTQAAGPERWEAIVQLAYTLGVDEVVAPDVMGDAQESAILLEEFIEWADINHPTLFKDFHWMGAAHGTSIPEVMASIGNLGMTPEIDTLGLPRILARIDPVIRFLLMKNSTMINQMAEGFSNGVHCLGGNEIFPKEPVLLADTPVRSLDTSFVASMSLNLRHINRDEWCGRPDDFWTMSYPNEELAATNHARFIDWSTGVNSSRGGD